MIRYYIPADSEAGARKVVDRIERGIVPALPHYLDPELAAEAFDRYPPSGKIGVRLWCIERRAVDDGRITNAWHDGQGRQAPQADALLQEQAG